MRQVLTRTSRLSSKLEETSMSNIEEQVRGPHLPQELPHLPQEAQHGANHSQERSDREIAETFTQELAPSTSSSEAGGHHVDLLTGDGLDPVCWLNISLNM